MKLFTRLGTAGLTLVPVAAQEGEAYSAGAVVEGGDGTLTSFIQGAVQSWSRRRAAAGLPSHSACILALHW